MALRRVERRVVRRLASLANLSREQLRAGAAPEQRRSRARRRPRAMVPR